MEKTSFFFSSVQFIYLKDKNTFNIVYITTLNFSPMSKNCQIPGAEVPDGYMNENPIDYLSLLYTFIHSTSSLLIARLATNLASRSGPGIRISTFNNAS